MNAYFLATPQKCFTVPKIFGKTFTNVSLLSLKFFFYGKSFWTIDIKIMLEWQGVSAEEKKQPFNSFNNFLVLSLNLWQTCLIIKVIIHPSHYLSKHKYVCPCQEKNIETYVIVKITWHFIKVSKQTGLYAKIYIAKQLITSFIVHMAK